MQEFKELDLKFLKNIKTALLTGRFELAGQDALELVKMIQWCDEANDTIVWQLKNPRPQPIKPKKVTAPSKKAGTRSTRSVKAKK